MPTTTTPPLILASSSPARRSLLTRAAYQFTVRPAAVEEPTGGFSDPRTMVQAISWLKASAVPPTVSEGIVLAADPIAGIGQPILKPVDADDARRIIRTLMGRDHELWTG